MPELKAGANVALRLEGDDLFIDAVGGGGPLEPDDIHGLVAWWKADALELDDSDPVGTWPDSGPRGLDLTQGTGSRMPTFVENELNGLPVVRFDGGDILSTAATYEPGDVFTLFAVVKVTTGGTVRSIIDRDRNTSPRIFQFRWDDGAAELISFRTGGNDTNGEAMSLNTWAVISAVRRPTQLQVFVDGSSAGATSAASPNVVASMATHVGGFDNGGTITPNFIGDMAELIIYQGAFIDTHRMAMEAYLADKWGLS